MGERNCAFDGCNALEFRTSGYCLRHKEEAPLEGLNRICGTNQDEAKIVGVQAKMLVQWQMLFDLNDLLKAKEFMLELMKFWKTHKMPAKRLPAMLGTYCVKIEGCAPSRKTHLSMTAILMARVAAGKQYPSVPARPAD